MNSSVNIQDCKVVKLGQIGDRNGHITVVTNNSEIPFAVKRVFYLYDIPGGESRGAHAHKECHQFLVAVSGAFDVVLDDGKNKHQVQLNNPNTGLHIVPGIWASEVNFSSGSVCLVLASQEYTESDYIRNYSDYLKFKLTHG